MRSLILIAAVLLACVAWTQGPDVPRLGWARSANGALRPIAGLAGNFVPGEPVVKETISAASSGAWTMAKTDRELIVLDRDGAERSRVPAASGGALFAFKPGGEPAAVYFPESGSLLLWSEGQFRTASWRLSEDEPVLALACPSDGTISCAVRRGGLIWLVNRDDADGRILLERALPGVTAPLLLFADGAILSGDGSSLAHRMPDGFERRTELPGTVVSLAEMGDSWVTAATAKRIFAVRLAGAVPAVFELPGGAE